MQQLQSRAVVIGAGISGLATALRLSELGVPVLVLEQGEGEKYPCNTRISGGCFHVAHQSVKADAVLLARAIHARTGESASEELVQTLSNRVGPAVDWLAQQGVRFIRAGQESFRQHVLAPPIALSGRNYWEGRGGDVMLRTLEGAMAKRGGRILRGVRAKRLLLDRGACTGVVAANASGELEVRADSVVVCDGGFHGNLDLLREFISPAPEKLKQRNAGTGLGHGVEMVRQAGARLIGMNRFYGHVLAQDALANEDLSPFPMMDFVCAGGVVVDAAGSRFMDEGLGGVTMSNAIAALPDPLCATAIFDAAIWEHEGREYYIPANPNLASRGATMHSAATLRELAGQLQIPAETLERTVDEYNAAVECERTAQLVPKRTASNHLPRAIRSAPFHAVRLCAGISYTMGGIAIDSHARVLHESGDPVPGLHAAGCAAGGIEGGGDREQVAYIGGLARAATFALQAANHIAGKVLQ